MEGFWKGLTALDFISGAVDVYKAKEQTKVAKVEAQTKASEDAQRAAIEAAKLSTQNQLQIEKAARATVNNEQMWRIASWITLIAGLSVAGTTIAKISRKR